MSEKMDELTPVADVAEAPIATAAVPVAEPAEIPMKDQPKQGSICCEFFSFFLTERFI